MSEKKLKKPTWWKNTYFWIAGLLFIIGIVGLIRTDEAIRDPGQKREPLPLALFYILASGIMAVNGILSHRQTVAHYQEVVGEVSE
ncbi:MAG: hypothetical protein WAO58_06900 [Fimbriimonadaceae bacterium]